VSAQGRLRLNTQVLFEGFVVDERVVECEGDTVAGEVVNRRAEAANGENDVGSRQRKL